MANLESFGLIRRKVATLRAIYGRGGAGAVLRHSTYRVASSARSLIHRWDRSVKWLLGKLVELKGNHFVSDGLTFTLDNPRISTRMKSHFFRGDYEDGERRMLARFLDPGLPTIEIGACIGIVSCTTNRRLENPERHVVIEANPYLIPTLEANRDRNGCRFTIVNRAGVWAAQRNVLDPRELRGG